VAIRENEVAAVGTFQVSQLAGSTLLCDGARDNPAVPYSAIQRIASVAILKLTPPLANDVSDNWELAGSNAGIRREDVWLGQAVSLKSPKYQLITM